MTLPIPPAVLYAGLAGVFLSLVVATAQQRWQFRVFVLLALRLAIGWHFLFEGLHKLHSMNVGPTETTRVFSSEPYFAAGEGPLAPIMRREYLGDPEFRYRDKTLQPTPMTMEDFLKLKPEEKANLCPKVVADDLVAKAKDRIPELESDIVKTKAAFDKLPEGTDDKSKKAKDDAKAKLTAAEATLKRAQNDAQDLRLEYAEWVYGTRTYVTKINMMNGDVSFSAPQRLKYIDMLQKEYDRLSSERNNNLGRGENTDVARMKQIKTEVLAARTELSKDTDDYINNIKASVGIAPTPPPGKSAKLLELDKRTAWMITAIGAGLLLGLFTRFWCVLGMGFLVMTYLTHPTVPWLTLPPMTEGNPLFINKNLIEALGLLVILAHPTGRWLGLDAVIDFLLFRKKAIPVVSN